MLKFTNEELQKKALECAKTFLTIDKYNVSKYSIWLKIIDLIKSSKVQEFSIRPTQIRLNVGDIGEILLASKLGTQTPCNTHGIDVVTPDGEELEIKTISYNKCGEIVRDDIKIIALVVTQKVIGVYELSTETLKENNLKGVRLNQKLILKYGTLRNDIASLVF